MTGESIMMEQKNHAKFSSAQEELADVLKERYEGKLFNKNWGWASRWLAAVHRRAVARGGGGGCGRSAATSWLVVVSLGALRLAALSVAAGSSTLRRSGKCLLTSLRSLWRSSRSLALGAPILVRRLRRGWWLPLVLPVLALPLVVSAFWWIAAPTKEGRGVLDRIAGFKQYLSITERERLDRMTPPEDTPELFERYLPYAIALGVENRWADRFAGVLAAAQRRGSRASPGIRAASNPWDNPAASPTASARRSPARSARPRPRRDRAAARAAADLRAAAAAAAAAAAGKLNQAGRLRTSVGSS